jgi:hypothetical protein
VRHVATLKPQAESRKQVSDFRTMTGSTAAIALAKVSNCMVEKRTEYSPVSNPKPEIRTWKHETRYHGTGGTNPETRNTKHETRNTRHETRLCVIRPLPDT